MPLLLKDHSRHASFASDNKKQTVSSLSFVRTKGKPSSVPRQPQIEPCLWRFLHSQNALWQESFPSLQPLIKYPMGLLLRHRSGIWQQPPSDARLLNREGKNQCYQMGNNDRIRTQPLCSFLHWLLLWRSSCCIPSLRRQTASRKYCYWYSRQNRSLTFIHT